MISRSPFWWALFYGPNPPLDALRVTGRLRPGGRSDWSLIAVRLGTSSILPSFQRETKLRNVPKRCSFRSTDERPVTARLARLLTGLVSSLIRVVHLSPVSPPTRRRAELLPCALFLDHLPAAETLKRAIGGRLKLRPSFQRCTRNAFCETFSAESEGYFIGSVSAAQATARRRRRTARESTAGRLSARGRHRAIRSRAVVRAGGRPAGQSPGLRRPNNGRDAGPTSWNRRAAF